MLQNSISSLAPDIGSETSTFHPISWQLTGLHDTALTCLSLMLLLLSTLDPGPFGFVVRLCWLASFVGLAFVNIGAAFALYIGSLAIYSPLRVAGWSSLMQRPDNYAVVILFVAMLFLALKRHHAWPQFSTYILILLLYCVGNTIVFSPAQFPALFRDIVIPLLACLLLAMIRFQEKELNALLNGIAILGAYIGLVSILEGLHASRWILPPWIGDPSLRPFDPWLAYNLGSGQAGGTLVYPAFNGLLLSMIFVMLMAHARRGRSWLLSIAMILCVGGSFYTYERGVWLGLIIALLWFPGWCRSLRQANIRRIGLVCLATIFFVAAAGMASTRLQDNATILYRFALWGAGLRLAVEHPLLGIGFFNFGTAVSGVKQGFGSPLLSYREITDGAASHNTLLTVLVEFGIAGLALYASMIYAVIKKATQITSRLWGRPGAKWVLAFVIVYFVNGQFISSFEGTTNMMFFGVLGVIAGRTD